MVWGRWTLVAVLGAAILALPQASGAQEISKGLNLAGLTLSFGGTSTSFENSTVPGSPKYPDSSSMNATLGLDLERLITDRFSLGVGGAYHWQRHSGRFQAENGALVPYRFVDSAGEVSAFGTYYLKPVGSGSPYATARAGVYFSGDANPVSVSVGVGYLRLLGASRRGAALSATIGYVHQMYAGGSVSAILMSAGFRFYLHSKR
jgi:hypothetical protein